MQERKTMSTHTKNIRKKIATSDAGIILIRSDGMISARVIAGYMHVALINRYHFS